VLPTQVSAGVRVRLVHQVRHAVQWEPKLAVVPDLPQPIQVFGGVLPVSRTCAIAGRQQADFVVVVQGAHRDTRQRRNLAD
jgi:hypothetical protein